jgi:hypothetical protein
MLGTLLQPLGHLPFDDAGIDAVATRRGAFLAEFPKERFTPLLKRSRRAGVALRQTTLQNLEASRERKPVGIKMFPLGGFKHQGADDKMTQRQGVQLLNDSGWCFAAELSGLGGPPRVLVRCGSSRLYLKTCRIGRSVRMPIAKSTHNRTSCVNMQARWLQHFVTNSTCRTKAGVIIFSNPASRSKIRPDSSGDSTQRPCRAIVTASLLLTVS